MGIVEDLRSYENIIKSLQQQLAAAQAREKVLREFIGNAQVSSGVCCCGDGMEQHASAMICGHSPVDQWDWSVHCLLAKPLDDTALRAALKAEREAGKLEAAQHILDMWKEQMAHETSFQTRLITYVEELK